MLVPRAPSLLGCLGVALSLREKSLLPCGKLLLQTLHQIWEPHCCNPPLSPRLAAALLRWALLGTSSQQFFPLSPQFENSPLTNPAQRVERQFQKDAYLLEPSWFEKRGLEKYSGVEDLEYLDGPWILFQDTCKGVFFSLAVKMPPAMPEFGIGGPGFESQWGL